MATKFEKTRIPFFSDVFVAVAVRASQGPYCLWKTSFMLRVLMLFRLHVRKHSPNSKRLKIQSSIVNCTITSKVNNGKRKHWRKERAERTFHKIILEHFL